MRFNFKCPICGSEKLKELPTVNISTPYACLNCFTYIREYKGTIREIHYSARREIDYKTNETKRKELK